METAVTDKSQGDLLSRSEKCQGILLPGQENIILNVLSKSGNISSLDDNQLMYGQCIIFPAFSEPLYVGYGFN